MSSIDIEAMRLDERGVDIVEHICPCFTDIWTLGSSWRATSKGTGAYHGLGEWKSIGEVSME